MPPPRARVAFVLGVALCFAVGCDDAADGSSSSSGAGGATTSGTMNTSGAPSATSGQGTSTGQGGGTPFDPASCVAPEVRCVDDTAGPSAEYATIQAAVDATVAGDTVLVFAGAYGGFRVTTSGTSSARIEIRAEPAVTITGPEAETNNLIRIQNASYVTIEGFLLVGSGQPQPYDYDYACLAARGATSNEPMHGITLRRNDVSGCSPSGMYLSQAEGLLLEGNHVHDNVLEAENGNGNGVYLANAGTDNVTVRGNRFVGNAGSGIHFNGDASIGGDGVQTGHWFERNVVSNNGANGFNMDGVQGAIFVNNVFAGNGRHGVRGFAIDASAGPKDGVFIHNTFHGNAGAGVKMTEDEGGHVLFGDLFVANVEGGIVIEETTAMTSNNLEAGAPEGIFADASAGDLRLVAGAAAIDAGVAMFGGHAAPTVDFNGFARSGAPDLGAFELGSSP